MEQVKVHIFGFITRCQVLSSPKKMYCQDAEYIQLVVGDFNKFKAVFLLDFVIFTKEILDPCFFLFSKK